MLGFCPASSGADLVTITLTLTNNPAGLSSNLVLNGSTRSWTNDVSSSPGTLIQTTNTIPLAATNLLNHLSAYPVSFGHYLSQSSPSNVLIRGKAGETMSVVINGGWAWASSSTQSVTTPVWTVRVPITVEAATNQTNIASLLVAALQYSTNALATNWTAGSNYLQKGAGPLQTVSGDVQFNGRTAVTSNFFATNGFTYAVTHINAVTSNLVNHGNAIRSEGPGGNSFQAGSNAMALGALSMAIGNSALASNLQATAVGVGTFATNESATAVGTGANVTGDQGTALGANATANKSGVALGQGASVYGTNGVALGLDAAASGSSDIAVGRNSSTAAHRGIALGATAVSSAIKSMALGDGAGASHSNSAAIGPSDDTGGVVATTRTNQIVLGTARHSVYIPGLLSLGSGASNLVTVAGSTNLLRGSISYPHSDLTTLAAGNNIAVPFGTNRFIRAGPGPGSAATICGIVGGATTGGTDGQDVLLFNDTGFILTLAVNTVDPVPANRLNSQSGADVPLPDQSWAGLTYDGTDAKWKVTSLFPHVSAPINTAPFEITTNDFALNIYYTNAAQRAWVCSTIGLTNALATDKSHVGLYLDQDADGQWEKTGIAVRLQGLAALAGAEQISAFLQPGARFVFTNLSSGGTASIESNSSQWVKQ